MCSMKKGERAQGEEGARGGGCEGERVQEWDGSRVRAVYRHVQGCLHMCLQGNPRERV